MTAPNDGMESLGDILARVGKLVAQQEDERNASVQVSPPPLQPDNIKDTAKLPVTQGKIIAISTRRRRQVESIVATRDDRERREQQLVYSSRPFVLCSLPVRRPKQKEMLLHKRRNGRFVLSVVGHPELGLPFGQDRLIPIWVATLALLQNNRLIRFNSAAEVLETFGLPKDGIHYRRLVDGFKRVFGATIFFGTDEQHKTRAVFDWSRFHFFDKMQLWYTKDVAQKTLPGEEFENRILLSEYFWEELQRHPIPIELKVVKALANAPAMLDFYTWLVWRCWTAKGEVAIPLFGDSGLISQLGISEKTAPFELRRQIRRWLTKINVLWPGCPAQLASNGAALVVEHAQAIAPRKLLIGKSDKRQD